MGRVYRNDMGKLGSFYNKLTIKKGVFSVSIFQFSVNQRCSLHTENIFEFCYVMNLSTNASLWFPVYQYISEAQRKGWYKRLMPLLKSEFLELFLELVSCSLLQYFVPNLCLKLVFQIFQEQSKVWKGLTVLPESKAGMFLIAQPCERKTRIQTNTFSSMLPFKRTVVSRGLWSIENQWVFELF